MKFLLSDWWILNIKSTSQVIIFDVTVIQIQPEWTYASTTISLDCHFRVIKCIIVLCWTQTGPGYPSFITVGKCFTSKYMNLVQFLSLHQVHFLDYNQGPLEPPMITTNRTLILGCHSDKCKNSWVNFHSCLKHLLALKVILQKFIQSDLKETLTNG